MLHRYHTKYIFDYQPHSISQQIPRVKWDKTVVDRLLGNINLSELIFSLLLKDKDLIFGKIYSHPCMYLNSFKISEKHSTSDLLFLGAVVFASFDILHFNILKKKHT